jgi:two-component system response regulator HydG
MATILVVDDQRNMRTTLAMLLQNAGHDVDVAGSAQDAFAQMGTKQFDVVLTDLRLGEQDGMDVLRFVKERCPHTQVVIMTAYGTIESAVHAMKIGAHDYLQKPFTEQQLVDKIQLALAQARTPPPPASDRTLRLSTFSMTELIGHSVVMQDLLGKLMRIAPTDATVLITGESGTGKELMARALHAHSLRAAKPFVPINCAAMTETLLESELFGHVRGAFTGASSSRKGLLEAADGGTFFFDEIAETSPSFQAKLLRALQEGEIRRLGDNRTIRVDVRVVAATNQDLRQAISERRFREDLYYRLNVVRFVIPPLRERRDDIPRLTEHLIRKHAPEGRHVRLGKGVLEYLLRYSFPGNIRELENLLAQGIALSADGVIRLEDIRVRDQVDVEHSGRSASPASGLGDHVDRAEREAILQALQRAGGHKHNAARLLGLSPTTLWRKMKRLQIR